jgi:AcrR family transcriptional regulator
MSKADAQPPRVRKTNRLAHGRRKIEILEVARDLFAKRGFDRTTMADIAEVVGVVESALYRHYKSKHNLLFEAIRFSYEPIIDDVEEAARSIVDPLARVRYAVWRHLRAFAEQPELCRLVVLEARGLPGYLDSEVAKLHRRYQAFVIQAVTEGVRSGAFDANVSATLVRHLVYGTTEHIGWAALLRPAEIDVERLTDEIMAMIEPGLIRRADVAERLGSEVTRLARLVNKVERAVDRQASA